MCFLSLFTTVSIMEKPICLDIFLLWNRQWGTEPQHLLCRFLGVSILQLLIIYGSTNMICWRCHSNSVYTRSRLPNISTRQDTKKTEHGRNWHDSKQVYCFLRRHIRGQKWNSNVINITTNTNNNNNNNNKRHDP